MLEKIIEWVRDEADGLISGEDSIPEDQKEKVIKIATISFIEGMQQYLREDQVSALGSLVDGRHAGISDEGASDLLQGIQEIMVVSLISRAGLNPTLAEGIASSMIPAVLRSFAEKINSEPHGIDLRTLWSGFSETPSSEIIDRVCRQFELSAFSKLHPLKKIL